MPFKSVSVCLLLSFFWFSSHLSNAEQALQCRGHAVLNVFERIQFLQMSQSTRPEVSAEFLSEPGCGRQMIEALSGLEAKSHYVDERSGYALVTIPRDKLLGALDIAGIEYAYTRDDDRLYYQDPEAKIPQNERKPEPVPEVDVPYPHIAKKLPPDGPYFAANEIGLTELWKQHPEADGRGVRVAVADEGSDFLHPELQEGRAADGKIVPKVADLATLTTAAEDAGWVQFGDPIQTKNGAIEAAGRTWIAPTDGTYRLGVFKQDLVLGPEYKAPSKKLSLSVGVLWDERQGKVWVDTDGDRSFRNERELGDYGSTHAIAWFGSNDGKDDNRIPFGLKIDAVGKTIYIRIGGEHGNLVDGALAGNTWTGGLYDGAAPSAQVVDEGLGRATLLASMVEAFKRPDVSVVNRSGGVGRAGYTGIREGIEDFAQRVLEREIAVYDKPIAAYSAAAGTIHVNDYAGPEMLRRNRQLGPPYKDTINSFVWEGLVNVVLAPSANLDTDSRYKPQDLVFPDGVRYMWIDGKKNPPAPDGYVIGANNSPTIPVVSGLLADLISEAKRDNVRYDAVRLNNAVFTGAHLLEGIPASRQGYGLINAAKSWDQLVTMAKADDSANPQLTSFTISVAQSSDATDVQEFHQDLAKAGEAVTGEVWITRHGGYAAGRRYTFSLRGDSESFELLDHHATLARDKPVRVRFRSKGAPGWNIAFLELRDAKADVVMQDVPLSVRAPAVPDKVASGVDKYEATIPPLTSENLYVQVGADVQAARYAMQIPYTGPENISTRSFPGGRYRTTTTPPGEPVDAAHHVGPMETIESLVLNDESGNQGIFWENRGRPEYATQYDGPAPDVPIHAELTVTKYAVGLGKTHDGMLAATNQLAEVKGRVELFDAKSNSTELKGQGNHAMAEVERDLPADIAQWRIRVMRWRKGATADAYLLNCTGKSGGCYIVSQQEITDKGASLVVDKPQAGTWKIVTRSREQVTGDTAYQLTEAQLTPTQTGAADADAKYASGEKWTMTLPNTTQYAAFRIAETSGVEHKKSGLLIAMTPLDGNAP